MKFSLLIFLFSSFIFAKENIAVEKTLLNLSRDFSTNSFHLEAAVKKKRKKRRRKKRRRRKRRRRVKRKGKFYLEFNLGYILHGSLDAQELEDQINLTNSTNVQISEFSSKDASISFGLSAGYFIKDWLALELSFNSLGQAGYEFLDTVSSGNYNFKSDFLTYNFSGKFFYYLDRKKKFNLHIKPSFVFWSISTDLSVSGINSESTSGSGITGSLAVGTEYFFTKKIYLGFNIDWLPSLGDDEVGSQSHIKTAISTGYLF